ncbi:zinc-finger-containing protein [Chromobacterium sp. ASV23]|uniref:zinc-finger-containing protein n=1 Tax=Chromobacterium sp. ASV23 TaxID=2795110 RepID=UPI0018EBD2E3|nr:zinc-finger-containing protein [Chromobacterium sp. ASV23]
MSILCPYCGKEAALTTGNMIYPTRPDLAHKKFYRCRPCDAYVGCHGNTDRPLGTPANRELRGLRNRAHAAFDPLWKEGDMQLFNDRTGAYKWLSEQLGVPRSECHIAMFNIDQCKKVVELCGRAHALSADLIDLERRVDELSGKQPSASLLNPARAASYEARGMGWGAW